MIPRTLATVLMVTALAGAALARPPAVIRDLAGSYRTTLVYEDLAAQGFYVPGDMVGEWTVTILADGHIGWHYVSDSGARSYDMTSVYVVHEDRLLIGADTGRYPCSDVYDVTAGVYTWSWQDGSLAFSAVEDRCHERRIILTAKPLVPIEDDTEARD